MSEADAALALDKTVCADELEWEQEKHLLESTVRRDKAEALSSVDIEADGTGEEVEAGEAEAGAGAG